MTQTEKSRNVAEDSGSTPTPTNVNRMINDLVHRRAGAKEMLDTQGLAALFEKYQLSARERAAFDDPGWPAFRAIGVLPVHIILLMIEINEHVRGHLSINCHMDRYRAEVLNQS